MNSRCYSATVEGIEAHTVEVEVSIRKGSPRFIIVGLPDAAVRESRDRVRTAIQASGYSFPTDLLILVNLAPGSRRKIGSLYDLPIALGILTASRRISSSRLTDCVALGELALDGRVRSVRGVLPVAMRAARTGPIDLLLSPRNAREAAMDPGVRARPVATLAEAASFVAGEKEIEPARVNPADLLAADGREAPDLSDVRGQETAKRALEIAAAGAHNLLLTGPPGSGKTMLARRLPGILPPLSLAEALETTTVHSVAGDLGDSPLVSVRPFRAPHHSISMAGLIGGGPQARPGEACLAHNGVLFLDELPEFDRRTLDALRQPLEEGETRISRVAYSVRYPARFALVAARNPCRCGKYGVTGADCRCTPPMVAAYSQRVSGPFLDRVDMHVAVPRVKWSEISTGTPSEATASVRGRVLAARERQASRLRPYEATTNAAMPVRALRALCRLDGPSRRCLKAAMSRFGLSARGHDRVLRVARTIADLMGSEEIREHHVREAVTYREQEWR